MGGRTVEVNCKCCGIKFPARVADRKRGWGKFCHKSCAAYWKTHHKRRPPQTPLQLAAAQLKNEFLRETFNRGCRSEVEVDISDMDYGASDGGGYHSR